MASGSHQTSHCPVAVHDAVAQRAGYESQVAWVPSPTVYPAAAADSLADVLGSLAALADSEHSQPGQLAHWQSQ